MYHTYMKQEQMDRGLFYPSEGSGQKSKRKHWGIPQMGAVHYTVAKHAYAPHL